MLKTLNDLRLGDSAVVRKIGGEGEIRRRIMDMGVVKGVPLKVEKIAPLGDPIDIIVQGYHLSLRRSEAKNILVAEVGHE